MPDRWGLYLRSGVGDRIMAQKEFSFAPLVRDGRRMLGCIASIHNMNFLLAMETPSPENPGDPLEGVIYRPAWFKFIERNTREEAQIFFSWDKRGDDKGITIAFDKAAPG